MKDHNQRYAEYFIDNKKGDLTNCLYFLLNFSPLCKDSVNCKLYNAIKRNQNNLMANACFFKIYIFNGH